jgi:cell fate regulator YaaT (PSP1 superfamily)
MATVQVRFKGNRRGFYRWAGEEEPLRLNEAVLVEAERGLDFGRVNALGEAAARKCDGCSSCGTGDVADQLGIPVEPPEQVEGPTPSEASPAETSQPRIVRRAKGQEIAQHEELRRSEEDARRHVAQRVAAQNLTMRISDTEWQWDRSRLTVYFTAEKRVDFRNLVRELASHFHARIDLRQIGVRDEAARLGGVGRCGREFCCSTWLKAPGPVNLALAKDQRLSLNPTQISGGCGRLLCCLRYEHEFYVEARKRFPKEGKTLQTLRGAEKVVAVDIFRERVFLRSEEQGPRIIPVLELRDEMDEAVKRTDIAPPEATVPEAKPVPPRGSEAKVTREAGGRGARQPDSRTPRPTEDRPAAGASSSPEDNGQPDPRRPRRRRRRRRGGGESGGEKGGAA